MPRTEGSGGQEQYPNMSIAEGDSVQNGRVGTYRKEEKKWMGSIPSECDLCGMPILQVFVDGKTRMGSWANMCLSCFKQDGVGLGTGLGQKYQLQTSGDYENVE